MYNYLNHAALELLFTFKYLRIFDNYISPLIVSVVALYCRQVYFWNGKTQWYSGVVGDTWKVSFTCHCYCVSCI